MANQGTGAFRHAREQPEDDREVRSSPGKNMTPIRASYKLTAKDWAFIDDALVCHKEFWSDEASDDYAKELHARLKSSLDNGERIVIDPDVVSTDEETNAKLLPEVK